MKNYDQTNMVLRYFMSLENHEERFALLTDFLERSGIHRVILFSAPFAGCSSIFPTEYYRKHAAMLRPYIQQLREKGVEVGINMLYTIGHAYYADEKEFGFRRAVTLDGEPSRGCVCLRDEHILDYVKEIYGYYAELEPTIIFMDDDLRAVSLGQFVCACDHHLSLISQRLGRPITREELRAGVYSEEFEQNEVKKAFFDQAKEDLEQLMITIAEEVRRISPETKVGMMTTTYPEVTIDRDFKEFFQKNYEKGITAVRTGMNFYREGEAKDIPLMFSMPAIQRTLIDDDRVELQPEIENDIYSFFYKSNAVTEMQILWCITNGLKNMQINLFHASEAQNYEEITGALEKKMKFFNAVTRLIPENHRTQGVNIYVNPKSLRNGRAKGEKFFFSPEWFRYLQIDGIPLGYDRNASEWMFLSGDDVLGATNEEIDQILRKGAVMDARAAECLVYRGFGRRIGIEQIETMTGIFAGERFTFHALNGEYGGRENSDYFWDSLHEKGLVKQVTYCEGAEQLSNIVNHRQEKVCNGVTVYENAQGERFCVIPTDHNIFSQFVHINHRRKAQLIRVFEWIARKELPIYSCNEMVCSNINEFAEYQVITLFNLTSDDIERPKIAYRVKHGLKYVANDGSLRPLIYDTDGRIITIKKQLKTKGVLVIVDEA